MAQRRRYSYQPSQRRDKFDWPEPEMHPSMGIQRHRHSDTGWIAAVGNTSRNPRRKCFADSHYGGREESLAAAEAWYAEQVKERKLQRTGWKLTPELAGGVTKQSNVAAGHRYYNYVARLIHGGCIFTQSFAIIKYGEDQAEAYAHYALDLWRKQIAAIAKLPKERQQRIAWGLEEFTL